MNIHWFSPRKVSVAYHKLPNAQAHLRGALAGPPAAFDSLTFTFSPKGRSTSVPCQVQRLVRWISFFTFDEYIDTAFYHDLLLSVQPLPVCCIHSVCKSYCEKLLGYCIACQTGLKFVAAALTGH